MVQKMKNKQQNTPIIVANTQWTLPENLVKWVKEERMIDSLIELGSPNILSPEESVGYAECVAYLNPATNQAPLSSNVTEIYLYCFTQLMKRKKMFDAIPKECIIEKLSDYQMEKLNEFKRWIYKKRGGKERNHIINTLKEVFLENKK